MEKHVTSMNKKTLFLFLNRLGQPDLCRPRSTTKRCSAFSCFVLSRLWNRGGVWRKQKKKQQNPRRLISVYRTNARARSYVRYFYLLVDFFFGLVRVCPPPPL